ncbi:uncharacterized protein CEXT_424271 [Caerostris extrusa]|uniref:Ig-like domain-containing protein n=1 Tax=Caerostris extrusa TaxID=172846 RepID=A0AAV4UVS4_CAEEX|nr:uncharacterized protein CEXT_424271 [Caerostris extrusa]
MIEGRSGEVNMTAKGYPEVHSYRWSKNGSFIPRRSDGYGQSPRVTSDGAALPVPPLTLNVLYPAVVFNITESIEVAEGESAQLECSADGNPLSEDAITWRYQGSTGTQLDSVNTEPGHSLLTIMNATKNDAKKLECIADNGIGVASIRTAQLIVLYRPVILKGSSPPACGC